MQSRYTIFENEGEPDIRCVTTFGVNSKETDNPFGHFGSGWKIAIGILLRNKQKVTIQIGLETYTFDLKPTRIRVDDFDIVTMNGQELGFTSQVGKDWELWMAYRELYCNAKDEDGDSHESSSFPTPEAGITRVIVEGEEFSKIHEERSTFILSTVPLLRFDFVNIHHGVSEYVFYQGIKVGVIGHPNKTLFTYDISKGLALTEDRTLRYSFQAIDILERAVLQSSDTGFIKKILTADELYAESRLVFVGEGEPSEAFLGVAQKLYADKSVSMNLSAVRVLLIATNPEDLKPKPTELNRLEERQLEKAIAFCRTLRFPVDDVEIVVTESLGTSIIGLAEGGVIYVSREAFDMGTKMVASTLIEEYIHLFYGHVDCTRAMQNFLFNKMVSLGEQLNEEPL